MNKKKCAEALVLCLMGASTKVKMDFINLGYVTVGTVPLHGISSGYVRVTFITPISSPSCIWKVVFGYMLPVARNDP